MRPYIIINNEVIFEDDITYIGEIWQKHLKKKAEGCKYCIKFITKADENLWMKLTDETYQRLIDKLKPVAKLVV